MTIKRDMTSRRAVTPALYRCLGIALLAATVLTERAAAAGSETYKLKCAGCHGADGSGATPMGKKFKLRDLRSADVQKQSDEELTAVIVNGKTPMPPFGKTLDAPKVQELVAYLRSVAAK